LIATYNAIGQLIIAMLFALRSLDDNHDGILEAEELREFVEDFNGVRSSGRSSHRQGDTDIDDEVKQIIKHLDRNNDAAVTLKDLKR
jgi:Ca2+-binding EF-hand superfamily protein